MSCIVPIIELEPLVDMVNHNAIVTNTVEILNINLYKVKVGELDFVSQYRLECYRKDYIHALLVWFDVKFKSCQPSLIINTGPFNKFTHWKQTVFYINKALAMNKGDIISGTIAVKKNKRNPRATDIKISTHVENNIMKFHGNKFYSIQ